MRSERIILICALELLLFGSARSAPMEDPMALIHRAEEAEARGQYSDAIKSLQSVVTFYEKVLGSNNYLGALDIQQNRLGISSGERFSRSRISFPLGYVRIRTGESALR